jgi:Ca2+-binding RTX toxin-like protein
MPVTPVIARLSLLESVVPKGVNIFKSDLIALSNGTFVAAWSTSDKSLYSDTKFRILNADGTPVTGEIAIPQGATVASHSPDVDVLADGRFLLSWHTFDRNGNKGDTLAQIYNVTGTAASAPVSLGIIDSNFQISVLPDGGFLGFSSNFGVVSYRVYNAAGTQLGPTRALTSQEQGNATSMEAHTLDNGKVIVTWEHLGDGIGTDPYSEIRGIRARILNADGSFSGIDFSVNTTTVNDQLDVKLAVLGTGGFVITWKSLDPGDGSGSCIRARIFTENGTAIGNDFIVNTLAEGTQQTPNVVGLNDGRFVIVWDSDHVSGTGGDIRAKLYNANGTAASEEFIVGTSSGATETSPLVEVLDNGNLVFSWIEYNLTMSTSNVVAAVFNPGISPINGTTGNDGITGTLAGDTINGLAGDDNIYGLAGRDTLNGGDGNDNLFGGAGADKHNGGAGFDYARYDNSAGAVSAALFNPTTNTGEAQGDTYSQIEGLVGSAFSDYLYGDTLANDIYGLNGNDWIDGMGGSDILNGNDGDDHLVSRAGVQVLKGGNGFDYARYDYAMAGVAAALYNPSLNNGDAAGDVYDGIEGLVGGAYADYLYGNTAANALYGNAGDDWLDGLGGYDILVGGDGNDNLVSRAGAQYFDGGAGFDYVRYETSNGGVAVVLYSSNYNTGEAKGDTYIGIEGVVGSLYDDAIYGDGASNYLFGSNGNDTLDGVGGRDYLYGGDGNDSLISRAGAEAFDGGAGADLVRYVYATAGLVASLASSALNTGEAKGDSYVGVENLLGSGFDDYLYGDSAANTIYGGAGNDWLVGSAGGDTLTGEAGNDKLVGGIGRDGLTGGTGSDTFIFYSASESGATSATGDVIRDFQHLTDLIDLSAIDAKYSTVANDSFTFIGSAAFTAEGQIRAIQSGANTLIEVNAGGTSGAETSVLLAGVSFTTITANDFIL